MYIELYSLTEFWGEYGTFTLPSKLLRYIEFENVVVFFLDNNGKRDKVVGIKYSREGGINRLYMAWEFQSIDNFGKPRHIDSMYRTTYQGKELVACFVSSWLTEYLIDPNDGKVLFERPEK